VKWYGVAGPQLSLLVGAKEKVIISGNEADPSLFTSAKEQTKTLDLDLVLGGGTDIYLDKNLYISVGLMTYFGLLDMNSKNVKQYHADNGGGYGASRNFNFGAQVGVHYVFDWIGNMYR
jgi:hypothetical protein